MVSAVLQCGGFGEAIGVIMQPGFYNWKRSSYSGYWRKPVSGKRGDACGNGYAIWLYGYEIGWAFAAILDSALTKVEGDLEVGDFYRAQTLLAILTQESYRRIAIWDFDLPLDLGAG